MLTESDKYWLKLPDITLGDLIVFSTKDNDYINNYAKERGITVQEIYNIPNILRCLRKTRDEGGGDLNHPSFFEFLLYYGAKIYGASLQELKTIPLKEILSVISTMCYCNGCKF